jgi:hypothetical protein
MPSAVTFAMRGLSIVIPHWPLDEETDAALRRCLESFPLRCERIVVVNDGTGYARNVNIGLRLASADYCAVVNNDCRLDSGDIYDLCVAETVASPLVIGEREGFGESIEPGGVPGSFWVVPRAVLDRVGLLASGSSAPTGRMTTSSPVAEGRDRDRTGRVGPRPTYRRSHDGAAARAPPVAGGEPSARVRVAARAEGVRVLSGLGESVAS